MKGRRPPETPAARAPSPRRTSGGSVLVCRLRVPLPETAWVATFSRENPEVRVEVLSRIDLTPRRSLTELRLHVPEPGPWVEEMRALPQVEEVETLGGGPSALRLRVVHRTSEFVPIFRRFRLMRRFPFTIENGEATWIVRARPETVDDLVGALRPHAPGVRVESVHRDLDDGAPGILTRRQAEVFRRAMAAGYFDVPRGVTLTELARELGLAISSLSESLAVIEKKLLESLPPTAV